MHVPLKQIFPHPDNPRQDVADAQLEESIREQGLLAPLVVREYGSGTYQILDGHRRFHALQNLSKAHAEVTLRCVDDNLANFILLEANLQQKTLEPVEEARALACRMKKFGRTQAQLAKDFNRSPGWVSQRLVLLPAEERPKREDRPPGPGRPPNAAPELFTRVNNSEKQCEIASPGPIASNPSLKPAASTKTTSTKPTAAREVRSAPTQTQASVAKAVEQQKLSTRETSDLVDALKQVPEKRQAEVAEIASKSANPVGVAKTLAASLQKKDPEPDRPLKSDVHPYFGSNLENYVKDTTNFADKRLKRRLLAQSQPGRDDCTLEWRLMPDDELLSIHAGVISDLVNGLTDDLSALRAEVNRRCTGADNLFAFRRKGA